MERFHAGREYSNVILDTHQYLMVAEARGCSQTIEGYLKYIREERNRSQRWKNISR